MSRKFANNPRMTREAGTVSAMIALFCRRQHHSAIICSDCAELKQYALERLDKCPFQEGKTVCSLCPVHCYKPEQRDKIRRVMRYSGPRMMYLHPVMAIYHLIDKRRKEPAKTKQTSE